MRNLITPSHKVHFTLIDESTGRTVAYCGDRGAKRFTRFSFSVSCKMCIKKMQADYTYTQLVKMNDL